MRRAIVFGCLIFLVGMTGLKVGLTYVAGRVADAIWADPSVSGAPHERQAEAVAAYIFQHFTRYGYGEGTPLWVRLRPVLTSRYLPAVWRVKPGVLETLAQRGWCDDSARHLSFVLSRRGYKSQQWNMVTPVGGHSALRVDVADGQTALFDPYYGYVTRAGDQYLSPEQARTAMKKGRSMARAFVSLGVGSDDHFYRDFAEVDMHAQGEPITYVSVLPRAGGLTLGTLNGKGDDVMSAAGAHRLKPIWDYAGHKYDRAVTRVFVAGQDSELSMVLTETLTKAVRASFSPPPDRIDGHTVVWDLRAGERLILADGKAGFMPFKMRSYIPIDQILIRAHLSGDNNGGTP